MCCSLNYFDPFDLRNSELNLKTNMSSAALDSEGNEGNVLQEEIAVLFQASLIGRTDIVQVCRKI